MSGLDLTSIRTALPESPRRVQQGPVNLPGAQSALPEQNDDGDMDLDIIDPQDWTPDEGMSFLVYLPIITDTLTIPASINYLRELTSKSSGHPHARRVPVTNTWIQAKFQEIPSLKRDRLLAGHVVEDAFPDYDQSMDRDGCLQLSKFAKGSELAIQACIREHIRFLCAKEGSKTAFPEGHVTAARRERFLADRLIPNNPDRGSTADACCPDLEGSACSEWNLTFIDSVAKDFIAKVRTGMYLDHDLPVEARNERLVKKRVKNCLRSMIKKARKLKRLDTNEKMTAARAVDKYMQRRRVKHQARLKTCDKSVKYQKYFPLLKAVGPEGNSDEESDEEMGVTPVPIRVFPMKWRSKPYARLLHNLDEEAKGNEVNPLLRIGPIRTSTRSSRATRPRLDATERTKKTLPVSCPPGKPLQFYDASYLRDVKRAGLLPQLRVGTAYTHALPRA